MVLSRRRTDARGRAAAPAPVLELAGEEPAAAASEGEALRRLELARGMLAALYGDSCAVGACYRESWRARCAHSCARTRGAPWGSPRGSAQRGPSRAPLRWCRLQNLNS